jgi:hypothetical protein
MAVEWCSPILRSPEMRTVASPAAECLKRQIMAFLVPLCRFLAFIGSGRDMAAIVAPHKVAAWCRDLPLSMAISPQFGLVRPTSSLSSGGHYVIGGPEFRLLRAVAPEVTTPLSCSSSS